MRKSQESSPRRGGGRKRCWREGMGGGRSLRAEDIPMFRVLTWVQHLGGCFLLVRIYQAYTEDMCTSLNVGYTSIKS